jgi:hypothetical protein
MLTHSRYRYEMEKNGLQYFAQTYVVKLEERVKCGVDPRNINHSYISIFTDDTKVKLVKHILLSDINMKLFRNS